MTEMDSEEYVRLQGRQCPYCRCEDSTTAGAIEADWNFAWGTVTCLECKKVWSDVYALIGYRPAEPAY